MEFKNPLEGSKGALLATAASFLVGATEVVAQQPVTPPEHTITQSHIERKSDQNMPTGFVREQIVGQVNNQETVVGSIFWFDQNNTKTQFYSNDQHPEMFSPKIDYAKVNNEVERTGGKTVLAFPAAYKAPNGNIEGRTIENGQEVGENGYSKWSGMVFIDGTGKVSLHRCKDANENFDMVKADSLVQEAKTQGGSLFQQIPAIWNGVQKLNASSPALCEFRAICQTKDGKTFVLNCTEKVTLAAFLDMAKNLKDATGNAVVDDLMLVDTGMYSYGVFCDKDQVNQNTSGNDFKSHMMIDETYGTSVTGYTNVIVITKD